MKVEKIMKKLQEKQFKVVRVDSTEFELSNGDIYPIPFELDEVPSVEEFQKLIDNSKECILSLMEKVNG